MFRGAKERRTIEDVGFGIACATACGLLALALRSTAPVQTTELRVYDQFVRWRSDGQAPGQPITLIELSEADINQTGVWDYPVTDHQLAGLLERLESFHPAVIGLDIYRDLPVPRDGSQLAELEAVLRRHENIIAIASPAGPGTRELPPPPALVGNPMRVAVNDLPFDTGAGPIVRRGFLFLDDMAGETHYSLGFLMAAYRLSADGISAASDPEEPDLMRLGQSTIPRFRADDGAYVGADDRGYQFFLDYRHRGAWPAFSFGQVMDHEFRGEALTGRILLVAVNAESVNDSIASPLRAKHRGSEFHAQSAEQLLNLAEGKSLPLRFWDGHAEIAWIFGWGLFGVLMGFGARSPWIALPGTAGAMAVLMLGGWLFFRGGVWVPIVTPAFALLPATFGAVSWLGFRERRERLIMRNLFSKHVSAELADEIWRNRDAILKEGKIPGREVTLTVLMTDLAGYSTISESMPPAELFAWLNTYMETMAGEVSRHKGVVSKFIGDAIYALFGVPIPRASPAEFAEDAQNAVRCALAMRAGLASLNRRNAAAGLPPAAMRVGIHTGSAIAGGFGGKETMEYGVIGDTVNTAARLESYDKTMVESGEICRILVSGATWDLLGGKFAGSSVGHLKLTGKSETHEAYLITGEIGPQEQ